ncbi:carboxylesterase family protein [Actinospica durhamensis]|uniref:Carboxylic ester hydrolase n=1 Tax=Actinospica durhamensis TaxID=1508375 RepID=A0A941IS90_9ACTN|nr:carboxylesterase family protein [Actinospica durhamensis]MBR7838229.1 carboxylesterase family protein [Actinospica durhamensis]
MADEPLAETAQGTVRGRALADGGRLFAGMPFAQAPVGELRLRPPQPPSAWSGVRDAGRFLAAPVQGTSPLMAGSGDEVSAVAFSAAFPTGDITLTSEDCLYLNLWHPAASGHDGPLPVIVWFYGGGFEAGTAAPAYCEGGALARQTGAVVVTANYRLGALGFLHLADLGADWAGCTNFALQDQVAVLRWVRENVGGFGGDPGRVTVAGQSAGAFCIGALLAMPAAAGLMHRAILVSGSTSRVFDRATATAMAEDLLTALRLDDAAGLADVPASQILDAQAAVSSGDIGSRNLPGGRAWGAVLDGHLLPRDPHQAVTAGAAVDIPLLVSSTLDEVRIFQLLAGESFRPADEASLHAEMRRAGITDPAGLLDAYRRRVADPEDLSALRCAFLTDAVFRVPVLRLARAQVLAGGRAYHASLLAAPCGPQVGAFHGTDLLYLFDKLALVDADTAEHRAARETLTRAWASFAATGDPGWAVYEPGAAGNSRAVAGASYDGAPMVTEPPRDGAAALWPTEP